MRRAAVLVAAGAGATLTGVAELAEFLTLKPVIAAAMLAVLWTLEGVAPLFPGRRQRWSHALANVGLGLLNAAVASAIFAAATLAVSEGARGAGFGLLHWLAAPPWLSWVFAIVLFDAWMYGWHRLNHAVPVLWRFHSVHHSDEELDVTSALRFHTGEIVLSSAARLAVVPLLGMTITQLLVYEMILLPIILFHHSNVRVPRRLDRALRAVIVTPWMHWVHHSRERPETDSNFSSVLSVWDRAFRTFRLRTDPSTIDLGLGGYHRSRWRTLPGMLASPFRRMPRP